jgi:hypothetical protein
MITFPSETEIFEAAVAYLQNAHTDALTGRSPDVSEADFLGQQARALAQLVGEILGAAAAVDADAIPGTYVDSAGVTRTRNSSLALSTWAGVLAVPSSVAGQYGRRSAQAAIGGAGTATGTAGVVVTTGATLTSLNGTVTVQLRAGFTMGSGGTQSCIFDAVTTGSVSNLPVGSVLRWVSPPPGLASTVALTTALSDGYDLESDVSLAQRIVEKLSAPLRGGVVADFKFWAENALDGDGRPLACSAWIYPKREGTGTVTVCLTQPGTGSGRDPGATKAAAVAAYIAERRPCGDAGVTVVRPNFPSGEGLSVIARIEPADGYAMDWDDSQGTYAPVTLSSSTGTTLRLDDTVAAVTLALRTAIDTGKKPRVELKLPGYVLPYVGRATAYSTPSANVLAVTLDSALPVDPTVGTSCYAAGAATLPAAIAVLGAIDAVGPSRASGHAAGKWIDKVTLADLARAAATARDADGYLVAATVRNVGNVTQATKPGVQIKVGSGSWTAEDYLLFDNVPGSGPQLPYAASVLVHRGGV